MEKPCINCKNQCGFEPDEGCQLGKDWFAEKLTEDENLREDRGW